MTDHEKQGENPTPRKRIEEHLRIHPSLKDRIARQLLFSLHARNIITIDEIHRRVRAPAGESGTSSPETRTVHSEPAPVWRVDERERINALVVDFAASHFTSEEIDDIVNLALKREKAQTLKDIANLPNVSFDLLFRELEEFCSLPEGSTRLLKSEATGVRVSLLRNFISERLAFLRPAKKYISIRDLGNLARRIIGPKGGSGKIGGKSAGLYLAYHILQGEYSDKRDPELDIRMPESIYLRSDVYLEFMRLNGFMDYYDQKYKPIEEVRADYPFIRELFTNSDFPPSVSGPLRAFLASLGNHPLIVRSSSLLEDNWKAAFSGKYDSFFLANQGPLEARLRNLQGAIAQVYASTLGPDPIDYRKARNLIDYDEQMAVLIQKVVGFKYRRWFLPAFAGVAFSRNEYRWSHRIRKEDGLVRIVMGLGTRAVERVGNDYPRMIALTSPTLRPQATVQELRKYSQRVVDAINLTGDGVESIPLSRLIDVAEPFPALDRMISVFREGSLSPPVGTLIDADPTNLVITFDKLAGSTGFFRKITGILNILEEAYGCPVDIEFGHDGKDLYLLQCRPLAERMESDRVLIPPGIPRADRLFTARVDVPNASVHDVEYAVYADPKAFDGLPGARERQEVGNAVSAVNHALEGLRFILMGPGRWGSNDLRLGVPVRYGDIHNTLVLIEIAFRKGDQVPEVSFGTHFFQDLVEAGIHHLPLYPDDPAVLFREDFFTESPNSLPSVAPGFAHLSNVLRVLHIPSISGGKRLHIDMDSEEEEALGYLQ